MYTDNNLAAVNQELVKEWHPTKNKKGPQAYFANSHFKVWRVYKKCSYEWDTQIYNRNGNRNRSGVRIVMRTILNISNVK